MNRIFKKLTRHKYFSNTLLVSCAVFLVFLIVAGVIFYNEYRVARDHAKTNAEWSLIARPISARDHTIGVVSAPIQLILFSDFQCTYCASFFAKTLPKLQARYGNKLVVAYRHMPLPSRPQALPIAEASECIYQLDGNDAFWRFTREMYAIPDFGKGIDLSILGSIAHKVGVDEAAFNACVSEGRGKERVAQDKLEGSIAGISITPSMILKSRHRAVIVQGNYYSQLDAAISYLLETSAQIQERGDIKN